MRRIKKGAVSSVTALIVIVIVAAGVVAGIYFFGEFGEPKIEITNFRAIDDNGTPVIQVTIVGDAARLKVLLLKDENEIDIEFVSKLQLRDGKEKIKLRIGRSYETPGGGLYTVEVYHRGKCVASDTNYFKGPHLRVISFFPTFLDVDIFYKKYLSAIAMTIINTGDLPVYVSKIYLQSGLGNNFTVYEAYTLPERIQRIKPGELMKLAEPTYLEVSYWSESREIIIIVEDSTGMLLLTYTR